MPTDTAYISTVGMPKSAMKSTSLSREGQTKASHSNQPGGAMFFQLQDSLPYYAKQESNMDKSLKKPGLSLITENFYVLTIQDKDRI